MNIYIYIICVYPVDIHNGYIHTSYIYFYVCVLCISIFPWFDYIIPQHRLESIWEDFSLGLKSRLQWFSFKAGNRGCWRVGHPNFSESLLQWPSKKFHHVQLQVLRCCQIPPAHKIFVYLPCMWNKYTKISNPHWGSSVHQDAWRPGDPPKSSAWIVVTRENQWIWSVTWPSQSTSHIGSARSVGDISRSVKTPR